ncbi:MAG: hypothetical protein ACLFM0_08515, partial [Spirochaetales bacterium]
ELTQLANETVFHELRRFAAYAHERIAAGDFATWSGLLSEAYTAHYRDREHLKELSRRPVLRRRGITLETLEDYFDHVVVESRHETEVEFVEVVDEDQAIAYTTVDGEQVVLMLAVVENGYWKIGRY